MVLVKITMPVKDGKLVEWEDCVIAYREKEKRRWLKRRRSDKHGSKQTTTIPLSRCVAQT